MWTNLSCVHAYLGNKTPCKKDPFTRRVSEKELSVVYNLFLNLTSSTSPTFIETCHPSIWASGCSSSLAMSGCCSGAVFQHVEVHGEFP